MERIDCKSIERLLVEHIYIGDKRLNNLIKSGHLTIVGLCSECKWCQPPLTAVQDGQVVKVTDPRCASWCGFTRENGWCHRFEAKKEGVKDEVGNCKAQE